MLVENAKINEVVAVKLLSGEEVIGKLMADEKDSYRMESPRVIGTSDGSNVVLVPFLLSIDGENAESVILKQHVTATAKPSKHIKQEYEKLVKQTTGGTVKPLVK